MLETTIYSKYFDSQLYLSNKLGSGSHSQVFLGIHPRVEPKVQVAVKFMELNTQNNLFLKEMFETLRELIDCNQDGLCAVYECALVSKSGKSWITHYTLNDDLRDIPIVQLSQKQYLVIFEEHCRYGSISNYIKYLQGHQMLPITAIEFFLKTLQILQRLHTQNIVHGGISISNILIKDLDTLTVKLSDLSLSSIKHNIVKLDSISISLQQKRLKMSSTLSIINFSPQQTLKSDVNQLKEVFKFLLTNKKENGEPPFPPEIQKIFDELENAGDLMELKSAKNLLELI
ncbi:Protein_kinase domain [Hexamita inflata]|uniref:Protein kinase domain n=1 Tax=Hexamita inflata TaxID=28002 RepID=A0AA86Q7C6_9EUKA|nr:Protein kinase domain [Hexamita inflata]